MVFQQFNLFPHMTVLENVMEGLLTVKKVAKDAARVRATEQLAKVGLSDKIEVYPAKLSGGQQQRVAIARGLARRPRLMLLDEPFSALDAGLRQSVRDAVARMLRSAGVTTILVTHDQAEALSFADQLAVLTQGRLAQAGPPRELYLHPCDRETALFLGEAIIVPARMAGGIAETLFGRVPVAVPLSGEAEIMLRPEQLRLGPPDERTSPGVIGRVAEAAFGGSTTAVAVTVPLPGGGERTVTVRVASGDAPEPGARVRVTVTGSAHVFSDPSSDRL
jgi:iron(III) transport system ATP-binding protein